jgi:hypothetical protein
MKNYARVIPRDLFNEANLLKCLGKLWIETEKYRSVRWVHDGVPFEIQQDPSDGAISVRNLMFYVGNVSYRLWRPLNSRERWPLFLEIGWGRELEVFKEDGSLSDEMRQLIERD